MSSSDDDEEDDGEEVPGHEYMTMARQAFNILCPAVSARKPREFWETKCAQHLQSVVKGVRHMRWTMDRGVAPSSSRSLWMQNSVFRRLGKNKETNHAVMPLLRRLFTLATGAEQVSMWRDVMYARQWLCVVEFPPSHDGHTYCELRIFWLDSIHTERRPQFLLELVNLPKTNWVGSGDFEGNVAWAAQRALQLQFDADRGGPMADMLVPFKCEDAGFPKVFARFLLGIPYAVRIEELKPDSALWVMDGDDRLRLIVLYSLGHTTQFEQLHVEGAAKVRQATTFFDVMRDLFADLANTTVSVAWLYDYAARGWREGGEFKPWDAAKTSYLRDSPGRLAAFTAALAGLMHPDARVDDEGVATRADGSVERVDVQFSDRSLRVHSVAAPTVGAGNPTVVDDGGANPCADDAAADTNPPQRRRGARRRARGRSELQTVMSRIVDCLQI